MIKIDTPKKPAAASDWPSYYIVYRLRERGQTMRRLSRLNRLSSGALTTAIRTPWPRGEKIIADAIGVKPQEIWPSRFNRNGTRKAGLHSQAKHSTRGTSVNDDC